MYSNSLESKVSECSKCLKEDVCNLKEGFKKRSTHITNLVGDESEIAVFVICKRFLGERDIKEVFREETRTPEGYREGNAHV